MNYRQGGSWIKSPSVSSTKLGKARQDAELQVKDALDKRFKAIEDNKTKDVTHRYDEHSFISTPKESIKTDSAPQVRSGDVAGMRSKFQKKADHAVVVATEQEKAARKQLEVAKATKLAAKLAQAKAKADPKMGIHLRK
jgi:hypothetical protein